MDASPGGAASGAVGASLQAGPGRHASMKPTTRFFLIISPDLGRWKSIGQTDVLA
jgi:hypothetical protein